MTTPEPIQYQTNSGTTWTLTPAKNDGMIQYRVEAEGELQYEVDRIPLPVYTDLSWANPESLLFSLTPEKQGVFGLAKAIERIKNRKTLYTSRLVGVKDMQTAYPHAFKLGVDTLKALHEALYEDDYYLLVSDVFHLSPTGKYVVTGYQFTFLAKGELSDVIPLDDWVQLYTVIQDAPIPQSLSCQSFEWQWLHQQEIQSLYQMLCFVPEMSGNDLPPLDPTQKKNFSRFSSTVLNRILVRLLEGCPIDVILAKLD